MWSAALSFIKWILGSIAGTIDAREQTNQTIVATRGAAVESLSEMQARIEMEREETKREFIRSGGRAGLIYSMVAGGPFIIIGYLVAIYFFFMWYDTLWPQPWNVEKFPPPFDETVNLIVLSIMGVSGFALIVGITKIIRK